MTMRALFLLSTLTAACLTPGSGAQDPAAKAGTPFVLEAGEIKVTDLIDRAAAHLGRNILYHEQELASGSSTGGSAGAFKLQHRVETDRAGCEDLLTTLLSTRGFAVTPLDEPKGVFEVVSMFGPRNREVFNRAVLKTPEQVLARPNLRVPVSVVVKLQHINATVATNALRPFFASTGSPQGGSSLTLGNVGGNAAMLLAGMQDQVANAIRMLQVADVPPPPDAPGTGDRIDALARRVQALEERLGNKEK